MLSKHISPANKRATTNDRPIIIDQRRPEGPQKKQFRNTFPLYYPGLISVRIMCRSRYNPSVACRNKSFEKGRFLFEYGRAFVTHLSIARLISHVKRHIVRAEMFGNRYRARWWQENPRANLSIRLILDTNQFCQRNHCLWGVFTMAMGF